MAQCIGTALGNVPIVATKFIPPKTIMTAQSRVNRPKYQTISKHHYINLESVQPRIQPQMQKVLEPQRLWWGSTPVSCSTKGHPEGGLFVWADEGVEQFKCGADECRGEGLTEPLLCFICSRIPVHEKRPPGGRPFCIFHIADSISPFTRRTAPR